MQHILAKLRAQRRWNDFDMRAQEFCLVLRHENVEDPANCFEHACCEAICVCACVPAFASHSVLKALRT
eukprot:2032877-Pyramimonas_sp.AAC.1